VKKTLKTVVIFSVLACAGISYAQQEIDACWKFQKNGDYQKAIEYGKLAVKKYPNDPLAYYCLGSAYNHTGENQTAYNILKKAESLTNDKKELIKIDKDIAQTLSFMNRSNDVIAYYNKALSLAKELGDTESQISVLLKMSEEYLSPNFGKKGLDKAIAYSEEALGLMKDEQSKAYAYNIIATAYHKKGDFLKEIDALKKIVDIDKKYKNYNDILDVDTKIGELYMKMKDYTNAEKHLLEAIEYGKKEKFNEEGLANAYKDLGDVYKNKGDKKKAKEYYQLAYNLYDSIGQGDLAEQIQKEINKLR
jgi:tetratricopeptide (TPR) repeat protein